MFSSSAYALSGAVASLLMDTYFAEADELGNGESVQWKTFDFLIRKMGVIMLTLTNPLQIKNLEIEKIKAL